jgi:hypothetical protein
MVQPINDGVLLEVIDKGLSAIGTNAKQALWHCLEKDFEFDQNKVPENLEAFGDTLKDFFGLGYCFLDALFRQYLGEATGEDLQGYKTFGDCVRSLRKKA